MHNEMLTIINNKLVTAARELFSDYLCEIILYGSFARGDFDSESDVDIAFIVDLNRYEIEKYDDYIVQLIRTLNLDFDIFVSINCIPSSEFYRWREVLPYYRNINTEGVRLVA
jgi:predicted nucleotidyltransferase